MIQIKEIVTQDFKCENQSKYKIYSGMLMNYWLFGGTRNLKMSN